MNYLFIKNSNESRINAELLTLSKEAREYIGFSDSLFFKKFTLPGIEINDELLKSFNRHAKGLFIDDDDIKEMLSKFCFLVTNKNELENLCEYLRNNDIIILLP